MIEICAWLVAIVVVFLVAKKIADKRNYVKQGIARLEHWLNAKDENDSD